MKILILLLLVSFASHARLITKPESKSVLNNLQIKIYVKADGSYSVEKTLDFEVINASKLGLSNFPVSFNPGTSKIKLLEGYVETLGHKTKIDPEQVSTAALNATAGFDALTHWTIKIPPQVDGSKIHLKYQVDVEKPFIPGLFAFTLNFLDQDHYIEKGNILIVSEIPIEVKVRDPELSLNVEHLKKKFQELKITLTKPLIHGLKDEQQLVVAPEYATAMSVATSQNWNTVKRVYRSLFDIVLNSTPTEEMRELVTAAKLKTDLSAQLTLISDHLKNTFAYVGEMRTVKGKPSLRMFKDLYQSKFADDKEMAAFMVVILRNLKYQADVVLASKTPRHLFQGMPDPYLFNRVLVRVDHLGETYWIDPTEKPFYELNHAFQFSGRPSLGLNDDSEVGPVPYKNPVPSQLIMNAKVTLDASQNSVVEKELQYQGARAFELFKIAKGEDLKEVFELDLGTRDIQTYDKNFTHFHPWTIRGSTKDTGLIAPPKLSQYYDLLLGEMKTWKGELVLGEPYEFKQTITYAVMVDPATRLKCQIQSPWIDVERKSIIQKLNFMVYDLITFKQPFISPDELSSISFLNLQQQLKACGKSEKITLKK